MLRYSTETKEQLFLKSYRFLFFLSGKYSQKFFDKDRQFATDTLKATLKKSNAKNNRSNW